MRKLNKILFTYIALIISIAMPMLAQTGTISGKVSDTFDVGIQYVSVSIFAAETSQLKASAISDASGNYTIGGLASGSYKVQFTPSLLYYVPEWYNDQSSWDAATPVSVTDGETTSGINAQLASGGLISGTVTNLSGTGIQNVYVRLFQAGANIEEATMLSAANGQFTFGGIAPGSYKIFFDNSYIAIPYSSEWYNNQSSWEAANAITVTAGVTTSGINAQLDPSSITTYTISGEITLDGQPLIGVEMAGLPGEVMTNSFGMYSVAVDSGWSGTVIPVLVGYSFNPSSRSYINATSDHGAQDYTATVVDTYVISGTILIGGSPLPGVELSGLPGSPIITDETGSYSGIVNSGWSGTVIPVLEGYNFNPANIIYTSVTSEKNNQNYIAIKTNNGIPDSENGTASFLKVHDFSLKAATSRVLVEDFDGDLYRDLAIFHSGYSNVDLYINNTRGVFLLKYSIPIGFAFYADYFGFSLPAMGDFDGDGDIDLVIPNAAVDASGEGKLALLRNNGNGEFSNSNITIQGRKPWAIASGDWDNDGDLDLAVATELSETLCILINNGSGNFSQTESHPIGDRPKFISCGDFDGDGDVDLAVTNNGSYTVMVFANAGTGSFTFASTMGTEVDPRYTIFKDFDGDGDLDFLLLHAYFSQIWMFTNSGGLNFQRTQILNSIGSASIDVADFDGDGDYDVLSSSGDKNEVLIYFNGGEGVFSNGTPITGPNPIFFAMQPLTIVASDFDVDHAIDFMVYTDRFEVFRNLPDGGFFISGNVQGTAGAQVAMNGLPGDPLTDASGNYSSVVIQGWSGTVVPKINGYIFSPSQRDYINVELDQTGQDYTATAAFVLTFNMNPVSGYGILEGEISQSVLSGGSSSPVSAVANPGYSFVNWTGTGGFTSTDNPLIINEVTGSMTLTANFVVAPHTIAGQVSLYGDPMPGVVLAGLPGSPVSDEGGNYSCLVPDGWSGTVIPTLASYTFTPASRSYSNVTSDWNAQDYAGSVAYLVTFQAGANGSLSGQASQLVPMGGSTSPVTAVPAANYHFVNWTGSITSTANPLTVDNVTASMVITANFALNSLQVTSPNGGEDWQIGSAHAITWLTNGTIANVRIEYTSNGGSSWSIVTPKVANGGSYIWTVPEPVSANCLVRVSDEADPAIYDFSDALFRISSATPSSISITSPNGGENWQAGTSQNITWTFTGTIDQVRIDYSIDNGGQWTLITASTTNTGSYSWTVPTVASAQCKVRVSYAADANVNDTSDAAFSINSCTPPSWTPITGTQYNFSVSGRIFFNISASNYYLGSFGPGGISDCRSVTQVNADGSYYATVVGNANGEMISFKLYNCNAGVVTDIYETTLFESDANVSNFYLHTGNAAQDVSLVTGWNWISTRVLPDDVSFNGVFSNLIADIDQVKTQTKSAVNNGDWTWIGDLANMAGIGAGPMYKIKERPTKSLRIIGQQMAADTPINLQANWNWAAYLPSATMNLEEAIASIIDQVEQIKSSNHSATRIGGVLKGDLKEMEPGEGYMIRMTSPGTLIYPVAAGAVGEQETPRQGSEQAELTCIPPWIVKTGTQYNMVAYGNVYRNGVLNSGTGYYMAGFGPGGDSDCRSISEIQADGSYYATIVGDVPGETIVFKVFCCAKALTLAVEETFNFQADATNADYDLHFQMDDINVSSPNGGEVWTTGEVRNITWNSEGGIGSVNIDYSTNNGVNWASIVIETANDGSYPWTIPNNPSANCLVRIRDVADNNPSDLSDAVFTIASAVVAPTISGTILFNSFPLSGVEMSGLPGNPVTNASGFYTASVDYDWSGIVTPTLAGYAFTPASRSYSNVISDQTGQDYAAALAPSLQLTCPNGWEHWTLGSTRTITWNAINYSGTVRLVLFKGGSRFGNIAANVPATAGSYSWTVGLTYDNGMAPEGSDYRLYLRSTDNTLIDPSDYRLALIDPAQLEVTSPNGGESWELGTTRNITWNANGYVGTVRLILFQKAAKIGQIVASLPSGQGSYAWTVGVTQAGVAPAGINYSIRLLAGDGSQEDFSDGPLTLIENDALIVDHHHTALNDIPSEWLDQASQEKLLVLSAGNQDGINLGLRLLGDRDARLTAAESSNSLGLVLSEGSWLPQGAAFELQEWRWSLEKAILDTQAMVVVVRPDEQALLAGKLNAESYLSVLNELAIRLPGVKLVCATVAMDEPNELLAKFNRQVRESMLQNKGTLFDAADIESWRNNQQQLANDVPVRHPAYRAAMGAPATDNLANQGSATWWLLARLCGWEGKTGDK